MNTKIKKLTVATCLTAMVMNTCLLPSYAISSADNPVASANMTIADIDTNNPKLTIDPVDNAIGKIQWDHYNVPQTQTVTYRFSGLNQTIVNYVAPSAVENASQIVGTIEGVRVNPADPLQQCGRILLVNPNGISFVTADLVPGTGGRVRCNAGQTTFVGSTLDLTNYAGITDNTATTPSIDFQTYTDSYDFANGIFSKTGTDFENLKEFILLGNGIGLTTGTDIDLGAIDAATSAYDIYSRQIVAGSATVGLNPAGRVRTPISNLTDNLVPTCTWNGSGFLGGGVRYFDFGPNIGQRRPNLGSQFQIALCTQTYVVGQVNNNTTNGFIDVRNQSNTNYTTTNYASPVKVGAKLNANGALAAGGAVYLYSTNPGQQRDLMIVTDADQPTANIFINNIQGTTVNDPSAWSPLTVSIESTPPGPSINTSINVTPTPFDTKNSTNLPTAQGQCLGDCGTPPDPNEPPPPPPPPPTPPTPPPIDGGGDDDGLLGLLGLPLIGLAFPPPVAAAAPVMAAAPVRTCPDMAAMPVYDENGRIKYLKIIKK